MIRPDKMALGLALVLATPVAAQNIQDVLPPQFLPGAGAFPAQPVVTPQASAAAPVERVLLPRLNGLAFVPSLNRIQRRGIRTPGVTIQDLPPLDDAFIAEVTPLLGQPLTTTTIDTITRAVVAAYRRADRPLVDAVAPEQDIDSGVVQIAVVEFTVGEIRTEQNNWFSTRLLTSRLRLAPGDPVRGSRVAEDLALLNENPFRQVELVYQRGTQLGRTDVILRAPDRFPLRIYAGFENTGTPSLGVNRIITGATYGNLFGRGHQLNYQYTTSADALTGTPDGLQGRPNAPRFLAHSLVYIVPLPWRDRLVVSGLYAQSSPWLAPPFLQQGYTTQASVRYARHLPRTENFGQELRFGYDFKRTNNNLAFGGLRLSNTFTEVNQFALEYGATLLDSWGSTSFTATGIVSPGNMSSGNTRAAFQTSRAGASAQYAYANLLAERSFALPRNYTLNLRATGQLASGALLASEQLGLGGATSARGYNSFTVIGDQGYIMGAELRAPPFSLLRLIGKPERDRFQAHLFIEGGHVRSRTPQGAIGAPLGQSLASAGFGFRYALDRHLDVRFDYGFQMIRAFGAPPLASLANVSLVASW